MISILRLYEARGRQGPEDITGKPTRSDDWGSKSDQDEPTGDDWYPKLRHGGRVVHLRPDETKIIWLAIYHAFNEVSGMSNIIQQTIGSRGKFQQFWNHLDDIATAEMRDPANGDGFNLDTGDPGLMEFIKKVLEIAEGGQWKYDMKRDLSRVTRTLGVK